MRIDWRPAKSNNVAKKRARNRLEHEFKDMEYKEKRIKELKSKKPTLGINTIFLEEYEKKSDIIQQKNLLIRNLEEKYILMKYYLHGLE